MSYTIVIPARFESTRLPGKPLINISGKPMIEWVWQKALSSSASRVVIGTDDRRIFKVCKNFGAETYMTAISHNSGTDRIAEVVDIIGLTAVDVVVNLQGDEPLMPSSVIDQVAKILKAQPGCEVSTLCEPITNISEFRDSNVVKVVLDSKGRAIYFSRAPVPFRNRAAFPARKFDFQLRHLGIYAYRVNFLKKFTSWAPSPIEKLERLEQLRAIHYGAKIYVAQACEAVPGGVDTEADILAIEGLLAK